MESKVVIQLPTEEQKVLVRKYLGTSEEDIRQAVANIRNWLLAQPHLPHVIDDNRLERMYINSKCRIEKVKKMLDAYYTFKSKFPDTLMNRDPLAEDIAQLSKHATLLTMPRLTSDFHRVGCLTGIKSEVWNSSVSVGVKTALMFMEFLLSFDYSIGYVFILDLKNVTAAHVATLTVRDIRALEVISRRAYSKRIIAIHFLNAPKVFDKVLSVLKFALPVKLQSRIKIHAPNSRTLFDHVPEDLVPNEMGGTGGSAEEIMHANWNLISSVREWYSEEDKYVVDESKRPPGNHYEYDLFGVDGSFKKLQVD